MQRILAKIPEIITCLFPFFIMMGAGAADAALSFIAGLFLMESIYKRDFGWLNTKWVQIALFFWLYMIAISFLSPNILPSLKSSLGYIRFILFAIALEHRFLVKENIRKYLLVSLSVLLVFAILDTYYQFVMGKDIFGIPKPWGNRLSGPFRHPRIGGFLHFLLYPVLLYWLHILYQQKNVLGRFLGIPLIIFMVLPIILSGERVQIPLLFIGFLTVGLLWKKERLFFLGTGIIVFFVAILVTFLNPVLKERLVTQTLHQLSHARQEHYTQIWNRSFRIFLDVPLFGVGPNNFRKKCPEERYGPVDNIKARCGLHPHNFYLEIAVETGIVGLFIILILLLTWIYRMAKTYKIWQNMPVHIGLVSCFVISFVPLLPTRSFFNNWRMALLWFIIGWLMASLKAIEKNKGEIR